MLEVVKHRILGLCYQWKFYDVCPVTSAAHCYTSEVRASKKIDTNRPERLQRPCLSIFNSTEIFH